MQEAIPGSAEADSRTHKKVKLTTTDPEAADGDYAPCSSPYVAADGAVADAAAGCTAGECDAQQAHLTAWLSTSSAEPHMPQSLAHQLQAGTYSSLRDLEHGSSVETAGEPVSMGYGAPCSTETFDSGHHAGSGAPQASQSVPVTVLMHHIDQVCDTGSPEQCSASEYGPPVPHLWADSAPQAEIAMAPSYSTTSMPVSGPLACCTVDKQSVVTAQDLSAVMDHTSADLRMNTSCVVEIQEKSADAQQEATSSPGKRSR